MKYIYKISGKISLVCYLFVLYQLWQLCQWGGLRRYLPALAIGMFGLLTSFILCLISGKITLGKTACWKQKQQAVTVNNKEKFIFRTEMLVFIIGTIYFGGRIIYSAVPYHGALAWELDEWMHRKTVKLEHNNFFEDGVEGVLNDLEEELDLPQELYITNKFQMTFEEDGTIQTIYTFMYGKDKNGETRTYLVDYDVDEDDRMTVWVDGRANATYDEDMRLEPMLQILEKADCMEQVQKWAESRENETYEILYFGRRSFDTAAGLKYLPGDADGDGIEDGRGTLAGLGSGGEIIGFEVSLYIPADEEVTPVRYIMEPEYISVETLRQEQDMQQAETAKKTESWIVDNSNGTMYFFLDNERGWRLVVLDAALGSRFYGMEKTEDGGSTWEQVNANPFQDRFGVTEGLIFFDEALGFAGLTGASQSSSELYITNDGGGTFEKVEFPMDTVTKLPELAKECGFTVKDYDYFQMPEKENEGLTVKVVTQAGETEGLVFQSGDNGATWEFAGIFKD